MFLELASIIFGQKNGKKSLFLSYSIVIVTSLICFLFYLKTVEIYQNHQNVPGQGSRYGIWPTSSILHLYLEVKMVPGYYYYLHDRQAFDWRRNYSKCNVVYQFVEKGLGSSTGMTKSSFLLGDTDVGQGVIFTKRASSAEKKSGCTCPT
ncbi:hypothetical protein K1719_019963 [Acacia pycnantha]|nr:hypothetical protein K1719_019963 [Acacia pycnantha]